MTHFQSLAFDFVESHEVHLDPLLKPVYVSMNGILEEIGNDKVPEELCWNKHYPSEEWSVLFCISLQKVGKKFYQMKWGG